MPRLYNTGIGADGQALNPPVREFNDTHVIAVPPMFHDTHGTHVPCKPGSAIISMAGVGHFVVGPNEFIDLPHGIPVEDYQALAPSLITEAEALKRLEKAAADKAAAEPASKATGEPASKVTPASEPVPAQSEPASGTTVSQPAHMKKAKE